MAQRGTMLIGVTVIVTLIVVAGKVREHLLESGYGKPPPLSQEQIDTREDMLKSVYFTCMDETDNEFSCLNRFGRNTWYPRDAAECEGIGARVDKVIALGGEPKWRDLFKNERCARRGLPHSSEAVNAGAEEPPDSPSRRCAALHGRADICREKYGSHLWYPSETFNCGSNNWYVDFWIESERYKLPEKRDPINWITLFYNERCWRLGREFTLLELQP